MAGSRKKPNSGNRTNSGVPRQTRRGRLVRRKGAQRASSSGVQASVTGAAALRKPSHFVVAKVAHASINTTETQSAAMRRRHSEASGADGSAPALLEKV